MSLTNVLLLLVAVAATNADETTTSKPDKPIVFTDCQGSYPVSVTNVNDMYVLDMHDCANGKVDFNFTIADEKDTYRAFVVQVVTTNTSLVRKGVVLQIDQSMNDGPVFDCKDANASVCNMIITPAMITTYSYRSMKIHIETPADKQNLTVVITIMSTKLPDVTVDVNAASAPKVIPRDFEYTTQGFMITPHKDTSSEKFTSMFALMNATCYLNNNTNTLKLYDAATKKTVLMDYNMCPTNMTTLTGSPYLEYMRMGVPMKNATWTGITSTKSTKINGATRSGLSLVAVLAVIVYQMMVKQY